MFCQRYITFGKIGYFDIFFLNLKKDLKDKQIFEGILSKKRKHSKSNEEEQKHSKIQRLNRWPTKTLKKTDLLLPADLRAILIGAPRAGVSV